MENVEVYFLIAGAVFTVIAIWVFYKLFKSNSQSD